MAFESPVRDLLRKLRDVATSHIAAPQVADFMNHMNSHLSAIAFAEEVNHREGGKADMNQSHLDGHGQPISKGTQLLFVPDGDKVIDTGVAEELLPNDHVQFKSNGGATYETTSTFCIVAPTTT